MTAKTRHYLDYNATAPVRPAVIDAVTRALGGLGNASSVHAHGRAMHKAVESARDDIAAFVGAPRTGLIFTSGGTEAVHLALNGMSGPGGSGPQVNRIITSAIEHAAVLENAASCDAPQSTIPVLRSGVVDLAVLEAMLQESASKDETPLVGVMLANNETGVIQPVREIASLVHGHGGFLFVDAAQAVGRIEVDFASLNADLMSFTAHKFGGPLGVGALAIRPGLPIAPVMRGGGQESMRRSGTTNAPAIVGFAVACREAQGDIDHASEVAALRDRAEAGVIASGGVIWGSDAPRLPGVLCYSAPGFSSETQLMALDLAGVSVSSGAACSSGKVRPSHVLSAMGASNNEANEAIRVSLGWASTDVDITSFLAAWRAAYDRVKARAA
ncbi:MAG: cysteine desulfurase family protein [Pseudomonadota bacterium]